MNKKILISLVFSLALFFSANQVNADCSENDGGNVPSVRGTTTVTYVSAPPTSDSDTCSGNNLTEYYCNGSARAFQNYTCPCNSGKCVECNTSSDCADQVCKVKSCSSNTCSYTTAPDGTDCTTLSYQPKQCKAGACIGIPSCINYENTVDSGETVTSSISTANADSWSAVCTDFDCSNLTCSYAEGNVQNYQGGIISDTITSSNIQFYNDSGSMKTRRCVFTVRNSDTGLEGTCIGETHVRNGISEPPAEEDGPTCKAYEYTINSGQSQSAFVSACATCKVNRWSAVCEDFGCDDYACIYKSPSYTQTYGETAFSGGIFGANNSYSNTSGVVQTRKCTYTVWNEDNNPNTPIETGTCEGKIHVNSGDPAEDTGCIGYNFTINSGQSQSAWISSSGVDRWNAICEDFNCADHACVYKSPSFTQNYYYPNGTSFENTIGANNSYVNNSGSTQTRKCNFTTWNSANPSEKKTCVGNVNVCSAGYLWNGVSCGFVGSCTPNDNCPASKLATLCPNESCFDGCSYKAGTKVCDTIPTLVFYADPNPINYNESTKLFWNTTNVADCWGWSDDDPNWEDGWKTLNETIGKPTGNLLANKTYKMECWNANGVTTGIKEVTVNVNPDVAHICSGTPPNGTTEIMCANDNVVNSSNKREWHPVDDCDDTKKCEYRVVSIPPCSLKCIGTDSTVCKGDVIDNGCGTGTCKGTRDCTWREVTP